MDSRVIKGVKPPVKYAVGLMTHSNATNVVSKDFGEVIEDNASIKQKLENSEYGKYLN